MKKIIFILLILFTILSFIFCAGKYIHTKKYSYYNAVYDNIDITLSDKSSSDIISGGIYVEADNKRYDFEKNKNNFYTSLFGKTDSIYIFVNERYGSDFEVTVFKGLDVFYFENLNKLKKDKINNYYRYNLYGAIGSTNFHSFTNAFCELFLAPFNHKTIFLPFCILLFITLIYQINNFNKIKINGCLVFALILILGIILRLNGLFDFYLCDDEISAAFFASPNMPFYNVFNDPGNPPFYYILLKFYLKFFGLSIVSLRSFSFILSVFSLLSLFFVLYKKFGLKTANTGLFLFSINLSMIYFSQEARSYILQILLMPLIVYYFFEILKKDNKLNFIIYGILAAFAFNTHFYECFFLASNFIFALIYFIKNKKFKSIIYFLITNLAAFSFFLFYFFNTILPYTLLDSSFNDWIPNISFKFVKKCTLTLFGGILPLFLAVLYSYKAIKSENSPAKQMIIYSFFTIFFVIFQSVIFSLMLTPILIERYLIFLTPLYVIIISTALNSRNYKYFSVFLLLFAFSIKSSDIFYAKYKDNFYQLPAKLALKYNLDRKTFVILNSYMHGEFAFNQIKENKNLLNNNITYLRIGHSKLKQKTKDMLSNNKNIRIFLCDKDKEKFKDFPYYYNSTSKTYVYKIEN